MNEPEWLWKTLGFIETNLKNPLSPVEISRSSPYSSRHFQRLFKSICAEGVMEYVRARRLTCAMEEINGGDQRILDIALDYQFESQEAFTRAFQSRFAFPPRRFRYQNLLNPPARKVCISRQYLCAINDSLFSLEPEIQFRESTSYLGITRHLALDQFDQLHFATVSEMSRQLDLQLSESSSGPGAASVANTDEGVTVLSYRVPPKERSREDGIRLFVGHKAAAGLQVRKLDNLRVPENKYAVFTVPLHPDKFVHAINYITGTWFPRSAYWIGKAPLTCHIPRKNTKNSATLVSLFFPLRERHPRLVDRWWH